MYPLVSFWALCFSSLFTVIDPFSAAPVFTSITEGRSKAEVAVLARRACMVAFFVLLIFACSGTFLFRLFGITLEAFRIGGGIVFLLLGIPMLQGAAPHAPSLDGKTSDPSVVPLGVPLIGGPGAITTIMLLMGQANGGPQMVAVVGALLSVMLATFVILRFAPRFLIRLGKTWIVLMTRIMGLIILVIGVQFIADGIRPIAIDILKHTSP